MSGNFFRRPLGILISSLLLAGCNEVFIRPTPPIPAEWPDKQVISTAAPIARQISWKEYFGDRRLHSLIEAAIEHNRDLRIAVARIEEARAQYGITKADRFPTVNLASNYQETLSPGSLGGNQSVTGKRIDVMLSSVSYEVDFWGRISGLADSALASYLATEEAQRSVRQTVVSEVANAYFSLLELEERAELVRATLSAHEQTRILILRAREAGYATAYEYLQSESALEQARATLSGIERERSATINQLRFLVGIIPDQLPSGFGLATQSIMLDLGAELPSEVILARPDVLAAEQRLMSAHANVGAARAAFLPKIILTGLFGTASHALAGLFAAGSKTWMFQPSITMPLFDGGRTSSNAELAEARRQIAVSDYEKTIQQAFREVADLLATRTTLVEQLRAAQANLSNQEERLKVAQALFKGGQATLLNVLDAQREKLNAEQAMLAIRRNQLSSAAQLYKALGGGVN